MIENGQSWVFPMLHMGGTMKSELCLRWLENNGWKPEDPCACAKPDFPSQILRHCQGCVELIDCEEDGPEHWCVSCADRRDREYLEAVANSAKLLADAAEWVSFHPKDDKGWADLAHQVISVRKGLRKLGDAV